MQGWSILLKIHNLIRGGLSKLRPAFLRRFHGGTADGHHQHKSENTRKTDERTFTYIRRHRETREMFVFAPQYPPLIFERVTHVKRLYFRWAHQKLHHLHQVFNVLCEFITIELLNVMFDSFLIIFRATSFWWIAFIMSLILPAERLFLRAVNGQIASLIISIHPPPFCNDLTVR